MYLATAKMMHLVLEPFVPEKFVNLLQYLIAPLALGS